MALLSIESLVNMPSLPSIADPTLFRGPTGSRMLDKGTVFFNAGERAVRLTAWNTAYLEWAAKNANKVGKATRADAQAILNRAQSFQPT